MGGYLRPCSVFFGAGEPALLLPAVVFLGKGLPPEEELAVLPDFLGGEGDFALPEGLFAALFGVVALSALTATTRGELIGSGSVTTGAAMDRLGSGSSMIVPPGAGSHTVPSAAFERAVTDAHPESRAVAASIAAMRLID